MRVQVNSLTYAYINKLVLNNLSFSLKSGDFLLVHGKNGTGKTTLIKCFLKMVKISNGMIFLDDVDVNEIKRFINIGFVPQKNEFNYEFPITVSEILSCAYLKKKDEFFYRIIESLDLTNLFRENINTLSGGQIQRVFIARALLNKPKLLILDEPTVGVDNDNVKALYQILKKLKQDNITIILISHDYDFCTDLADAVLTLSELGEYFFKTIGESK